MHSLQDLFINIMFVVGLVGIVAYVVMWVASSKMRREIEAPKYRMLDRDRALWNHEP